jgi:hypothetical protein
VGFAWWLDWLTNSADPTTTTERFSFYLGIRKGFPKIHSNLDRYVEIFCTMMVRQQGFYMAVSKSILSIALTLLSFVAYNPPKEVSAMQAAPEKLLTNVVSETAKLEREKFEYQKVLEDKKLEVERLKALLTGGSILIPLLLGIFTLAWQSRTATKLKDRDAKDTFELKAAEIVFTSDNAHGTKNKAKALTVLFPDRFPANFGDAFEPTQFGGPRFEAKLEVFKAACSKVESPSEVYQVWHQLFPGDKWIEQLLPNPTLKTGAVDESASTP